MVDKELMKRRFSRNLSTYREYAVVQEKMAVKLVQFVKDKWGISYPVILEVGCGGGLLTEKLVNTFIFNRLYANDIVGECEKEVANLAASITFLCADAEQELEIPQELNLVISNATFQWFRDLSAFITRLVPNMRDGGLLAFSTFGDRHFSEFAGLGYPSLDYLPFDLLKKMLTPHFEIIYCKEEQEILYFKTPEQVLQHVKHTGVNSVSREAWTKGKIAAFSTAYKQEFMTRKGVKLTYNPYYFIARKKS